MNSAFIEKLLETQAGRPELKAARNGGQQLSLGSPLSSLGALPSPAVRGALVQMGAQAFLLPGAGESGKSTIVKQMK